jgi:hypothetical protein
MTGQAANEANSTAPHNTQRDGTTLSAITCREMGVDRFGRIRWMMRRVGFTVVRPTVNSLLAPPNGPSHPPLLDMSRHLSYRRRVAIRPAAANPKRLWLVHVGQTQYGHKLFLDSWRVCRYSMPGSRSNLLCVCCFISSYFRMVLRKCRLALCLTSHPQSAASIRFASHTFEPTTSCACAYERRRRER